MCSSNQKQHRSPNTHWAYSKGQATSALVFLNFGAFDLPFKKENEKRSCIALLYSPQGGQGSRAGRFRATPQTSELMQQQTAGTVCQPLWRPVQSKKRDPDFSSGFCRWVLIAEENCIEVGGNKGNTYLPAWELKKFFQMCQQQAHPATCVLTPIPQVLDPLASGILMVHSNVLCLMLRAKNAEHSNASHFLSTKGHQEEGNPK